MHFNDELELANFIKDRGGTLYLVGGAIRDKIMGIESHDQDYVITGLSVNEVPFEKIVGSDFPVFLVKINNIECEVALARVERKNGIGYHGFDFHADKNVTIEDDLYRRDITINAIAQNVLTEEIIDPYNGIDDIKHKVLRATSPAFAEDPLRVYRVPRFQSKFPDFTISYNTIKMMQSLCLELKNLPGERVWVELKKVLNSEKPSLFFEILSDIGCLHIHFPELELMKVPDKHDGTAFNHTMAILDKVNYFGLFIMFGLLVHDFGKGRTPHDKHPAHHGHDELGIEPIKTFCERLHIPNKYRDFGILCSKEHMRSKIAHLMKPGKLFKWLSSDNSHFYDMLTVSYTDSAYREDGNVEWCNEYFGRLEYLVAVANNVKRGITGQQLIDEGYEEGPNIGQMLLSRRINEFKKRTKKERKKFKEFGKTYNSNNK